MQVGKRKRGGAGGGLGGRARLPWRPPFLLTKNRGGGNKSPLYLSRCLIKGIQRRGWKGVCHQPWSFFFFVIACRSRCNRRSRTLRGAGSYYHHRSSLLRQKTKSCARSCLRRNTGACHDARCLCTAATTPVIRHMILTGCCRRHPLYWTASRLCLSVSALGTLVHRDKTVVIAMQRIRRQTKGALAM